MQGWRLVLPAVAAVMLSAATANADAVTDWNAKANEILGASGMGTPPAHRVMAILQTATYEAVNAITKKYQPSGIKVQVQPKPGASVDVAIAATHRVVLSKLVPAQQAAIDAAYQAAVGKVADGVPKTSGVEVGEAAGAAVLAARADDGAATRESYRPVTTPGAWVPTASAAASHWVQRKPWLMKNASQFRPAAPPALKSEVYTRDYNEIKAIGEKGSTTRTAEQTALAQFWEATGPGIYHGLVRSIATAPGREITQNARLFAAAAQALDDAMIAVFDAKYHYSFWRPVTAIRNGDNDGNDATERDPTWTPLIDTPMHPEYPCAHCILISSISGVLQAGIGKGAVNLSTASPSAKGAQRSWKKIDDLVQEVATARIQGGLHYRFSTVVGLAMGKQISALAAAKYTSK
ncbi:MAG TPA: vanadium-dependent haloperoxidase [Kofleriaceae bacterium]|nr:vanadium-dependent haloperoxidase [Kofleriaceae bacterium]